jgi:stage II sporulation protein R
VTQKGPRSEIKALALLAVLALLALPASVEAAPTAGDIPELVRLHVIANSDSVVDQSIKLMVRDAVLAALTPKLQQTADLAGARRVITSSLRELEAVAANTLRSQGADPEVSAQFGVYPFPTKTYGDTTLPAGDYEALRIVIGSGEGHNWWCVLFPSFCYVPPKAEVAVSTGKTAAPTVWRSFLADLWLSWFRR